MKRFTVYGGAEVEASLDQLTRQAADTVAKLLKPEQVRTLALIGGYGRGEGGVERLPDGGERPHNNLDFLLIATESAVEAVRAQKPELDAALHALGSAAGIGMDLGIVSEAQLTKATCLVMWYDCRFGHRTLLGDAAFLPSLTRFTAEAIVPWDIRNLLVNRGTLLVINAALQDQETRTVAETRTQWRHTVKAVIGYGDALLYFLGAYDWSYVEKQKRMAARTDIPERFRKLYDDAMQFRFLPDYSAVARSPLADLPSLLPTVERVHQLCESHRLKVRDLSWDGYPSRVMEQAARDALHGGPRTLASAARRAVRGERSELSTDGLTPLAKLGLRLGGERERMAATFPVVAYELTAGREQAAHLLGAANTSPAALRRAYLRTWGRFGDTNFESVVKKLGLVLQEPSSIPTQERIAA